MSFTRCKQSNIKKIETNANTTYMVKNKDNIAQLMTGMSFTRCKQSKEKRSRQIKYKHNIHGTKPRQIKYKHNIHGKKNNDNLA